jgi:hypothetical protein
MDKKFIINLQGKEFVKFEGLLDEFHNNKGQTITTEFLKTYKLSTPKGEISGVIFKATVTGERGTYQGHGDADDTNVGEMLIPHKIRMAETRAIARALRLYNNIGMTSSEELGDTMEGANQKTTNALKSKLPYNEQRELAKEGKLFCLDCGAKAVVKDNKFINCPNFDFQNRERHKAFATAEELQDAQEIPTIDPPKYNQPIPF